MRGGNIDFDFNQIADFYDMYRPNYPNEIIDAIIKNAHLSDGSKLLEIGSGSGKATEQFVDFGFEMVCIEPGVDLAKMGKEKFKDKNVKFIVSQFEDYEAPSEYFDAIISGQAFHWVSQPIGFEKCAKTLIKGGCLSLFWYLDIFRDVDFDRELGNILQKYTGFVACIPSETDYEKRMENIVSQITESGFFAQPEIIHSYRDYNYSADEYFNYMLTAHLFHKSDAEKQTCHDELIQLAERYGGIKRQYTYELYVAKKK